MKITPAHDPNDFEVARRHELPSVRVIDESGRMTSDAGSFAGMDRFPCREAVVARLREEGLLVREEPYLHNVGHCYKEIDSSASRVLTVKKAHALELRPIGIIHSLTEKGRALRTRAIEVNEFL